MAQIIIRAKVGGLLKRLKNIRTRFQNGATGIDPTVHEKIDRIVSEVDRYRFQEGQVRSWKQISIPAWIFSRQEDYGLGNPMRTLGTMRTHLALRGGLYSVSKASKGLIAGRTRLAANILPLADTGRLFKAVGGDITQGHYYKITHRTITIGVTVPYARKHIEGQSRTFSFGATEKERLRRRVPPPEFSITKKALDLALRRRKITKEVYKIQLKRLRRFRANEVDKPYYRLYNWAKEKYPVRGKMPKRSWLGPLPPSVREKIAEVAGSHFFRDISGRGNL